jgi:hypothetical protein
MPIQFDPFVASQGLAAGLAGKLPEFQQTQNQKAQLDLEKQKQDDEMKIKIQESKFKDAYVAQQLLKDKNYDGIIQVGITRIAMEKGLGVDPSDTQTMVNLAIGAKNGNLQATTLLGSNLKAYVNLGSVTGVLNLPESEGVTSVNPEYDVIDAAGNVIRAGTPRPKEPNLQKNALGQLVDVETGVVRPGFEATTPSGSEAANKAQADTTRFSDGSMLIVSTDGTRTYLGPDGEEIKGAANIAAFNERTAELAKTDAGIIAANTLAMKNAVTKAEKGYAEVAIIRGNALTYQQAIDAVINDGANTGAIVSRFPSLTDGGKKLEQAQNVLSLDIVQSTTFGALSKGELDLAKATAIPSGLTEEALVEWIKSKMAADEKVANIIEEASDYMGITGNTISGYYREKRKQYNEDVAAVKYARENPDDPNSPAILAANPNL